MKNALLIVDIQIGFINEYTKHVISDVDKIQFTYDNVFATRYINPEGSSHRRFMNWEKFTPGSEDAELAFEAATHVKVMDKTIYSCVTDAFLDELKSRSIGEVHVCGIDTDVCVLKCAVDLFERGVRPLVLSELCASHAGPELHNCGLKILDRFIGTSQIK